MTEYGQICSTTVIYINPYDKRAGSFILLHVKRYTSSSLEQWAAQTEPKPLIVRGARQVGKSYLVRAFAKDRFAQIIELNFERDPALKSCFGDNDPRATLRRIEAYTGKSIATQADTLLFLDEIQAAPEILSKLRWFAEEIPELRLAAAGSLLDFALAEYAQSFPVGRVGYLHLEPMGFEEFLLALGESGLVRFMAEDVTVSAIASSNAIPEALHQRLLDRFRQYVLVGGMPAAVARFAERESLMDVGEIHQNLLSTLRDDFAKYANRVHHTRLLSVMSSIVQQLGKRFMYSHADRNERPSAMKKAVDLLSMARICSRVSAVPALGVPLAAGVDERSFKLLMVDVGLVSSSLGLSMFQLEGAADLTLVNSGAIAEQVVGQLLRLTFPHYQNPELYFWQRNVKGSQAEVDYVQQHGNGVVPIEVKAGVGGTLKSLHLLMAERGWRWALRMNSDLPSITPVSVTTPTGKSAKYQLLSLPIYLTEQYRRLLGQLTS